MALPQPAFFTRSQRLHVGSCTLQRQISPLLTTYKRFTVRYLNKRALKMDSSLSDPLERGFDVLLRLPF